MAFTRWPFEENFAWPGELVRAFGPLLGNPLLTQTQPFRSSGVFPPVNIYEDGDGYLVRAEMPGVDKGALDISVKGDQLTINGERKVVETANNVSWHRRERSGGQFRRVVTLPKPVNAEGIVAEFKNGVLEVRLPLVPEALARKITVH